MHHIVGGIVAGALLGKAAGSPKLRPWLKTAVKGGLRISEQARNLTQSVREQARTIVDEARTELREERAAQAESSDPSASDS